MHEDSELSKPIAMVVLVISIGAGLDFAEKNKITEIKKWLETVWDPEG